MRLFRRIRHRRYRPAHAQPLRFREILAEVRQQLSAQREQEEQG